MALLSITLSVAHVGGQGPFGSKEHSRPILGFATTAVLPLHVAEEADSSLLGSFKEGTGT